MKNPILFLFIVGLGLLNSCGINSDIMFRTLSDYEFDKPETITDEEYRLTPGDIIDFRLYANNGFMIIDLTSLGSTGTGSQVNLNSRTVDIKYFIQEDGYVKLPSLLRVKLAGLTVFEAEAFLEKEYSKFYVDPFVIIRVNNRRVIVSTGAGGTSKVVDLVNVNTRLIEALAMAGGIMDRGKASNIKLIRQVEEGHEVYEFDLSTIAGLEAADMIVQSNDIIYVEPTKRIASELLVEITPVLTLFTSAVAAYALILTFQ